MPISFYVHLELFAENNDIDTNHADNNIYVSSSDIGSFISSKHGWKRRAIALASTSTRHIKNTRKVCRTPKTCYEVVTH